MKYFRINLIKNIQDMHSVIYMSKLIESKHFKYVLFMTCQVCLSKTVFKRN